MVFVRRVFNPYNHNNEDENENYNDDDASALEQLDVNLILGINRFRLDLNLLFALPPQRILDLYVRFGGTYPHEIVALFFLLLLRRSQAAPIILSLLLEDVEFAAVSYLLTLRRPRLAFRIA